MSIVRVLDAQKVIMVRRCHVLRDSSQKFARRPDRAHRETEFDLPFAMRRVRKVENHKRPHVFGQVGHLRTKRRTVGLTFESTTFETTTFETTTFETTTFETTTFETTTFETTTF
jgi:hypothetical protein